MSFAVLAGSGPVHFTAVALDAAGDPDPNATLVISAVDASGTTVDLLATGNGTADYANDVATVVELDVSATATDPDGNVQTTAAPLRVSVTENTDAVGVTVTATQ